MVHGHESHNLLIRRFKTHTYEQLPQRSNIVLVFYCSKYFIFVIDFILNNLHLFLHNRKGLQNFIYVPFL